MPKAPMVRFPSGKMARGKSMHDVDKNRRVSEGSATKKSQIAPLEESSMEAKGFDGGESADAVPDVQPTPAPKSRSISALRLLKCGAPALEPSPGYESAADGCRATTSPCGTEPPPTR